MRTDWCLQGSLRMSLVKQEHQKMLCHLLSFSRMFSLALTTAYFWEMRRKLATSAVCCPVRILLGRKVVTWFHCSTSPLSLSFHAYILLETVFTSIVAAIFVFLSSQSVLCAEKRERKKDVHHEPPLHTLLPCQAAESQHLTTPPPQLDVYDVYICSIRMLTVYVVPHTFSVVFRRFLYCISWGSVLRWWGQWRQKIHTGV